MSNDGFSMFVCGRGSGNAGERCVCGNVATAGCGYPLKGESAGAVCNAKLCVKCGTKMNDGTMYCRPHVRLVAPNHGKVKLEGLG